MRVLLVENDPDCREMFRIALERAGAVVMALASTKAALDAFQVGLPDVVISDTGLEDRSGWAMIGAIRRREQLEGGRVAAIAVGCYAYPRDVVYSLPSKFDMHLSKPVRIAELVSAVERLASREPSSPPH